MAHWFVSPKEDVREVECELKCVRGEPQLITSHSTYSSLTSRSMRGMLIVGSYYCLLQSVYFDISSLEI